MKSAKIKRAKDACSQCLLDKGLTQCLVILKGSRVPSLVRQKVRVSLCVTWQQLWPTCAKVNPLCLTSQHQHSTAKPWIAFLIFHFKWEILAFDPVGGASPEVPSLHQSIIYQGTLKFNTFFSTCIKEITKHQTDRSRGYQSALFQKLVYQQNRVLQMPSAGSDLKRFGSFHKRRY